MKEHLEIISLNDPSLMGIKEDLLRAGDRIIGINGHNIGDQLDFYYYCDGLDRASLKIRKRNGMMREITLDSETLRALDIKFAPMKFQRCRNKCPFCFVDQMPKGLRPSLYLKDEDYRLGFLYGNYTTMNDISDTEIDQIVVQNRQPQYVSVHAIDPGIRENIFGRPIKRNIMDTLRKLTSAEIGIHAQIVLCPGLNDGRSLEDTVEALESLGSGILSLSVVPVGLTRYREGLPEIRRFKTEEYPVIIDQVESFQSAFLDSPRKSRFVFLSDEWYLGSDSSLPSSVAYEGFPQIDNGVGMSRDFIESSLLDLADYPPPIDLGLAVIATGELGARVFNNYIFPALENDGVVTMPDLREVENKFFGTGVTVSGLLVFEDLVEALKDIDADTVIFLPPNTLNYEGRFIDGPNMEHFAHEIEASVIIPESSLVKNLHSMTQNGGRNA